MTVNVDLPDDVVLKDLEEFSVQLAGRAGAILMGFRNDEIKVNFKAQGNMDPVTEVDLKVEEYLRGEISKAFPHHNILAEESYTGVADGMGFLWILDPLDGTANFASGVPIYAVSIGLAYRGVLVLGAVYTPAPNGCGNVYHARIGGGAYLNETQINVSSQLVPQPAAPISLPSGYLRTFSLDTKRRSLVGEPRVMGSIACEMAMVANGSFQYGIVTGAHIWDVAAGVVLVREAGGEVLEWNDSEWRPFSGLPISTERSRDKDIFSDVRIRPLLVGPIPMIKKLMLEVRLRRYALTSVIKLLRRLRLWRAK